jgi:hypothetical protein
MAHRRSRRPSAVKHDTAPRVVYTTAQRNDNERVARGDAPASDGLSDRLCRVLEARLTPYRIDTSVPFAVNVGGALQRDYLGGLEWSSEFALFIKHSLPKDAAEARKLWIEWWRVPYVYGRLLATFGADVLEAVLGLVRDRIHPRALERTIRKTLTTINRWKGRVMARVRYYLPYELYDRPGLLAQILAE